MIGRVKFGSFRDGLIIELVPNQNIEDLRIGEFIKILGSRYDFIGMITDLRLNVLNPDVFLAPPVDNELLRYSVNGTLVNSEIEFFPLVSIERESNSIHSVKSIPSHFDEVTAVSQKDMDTIFSFGAEKDVQAFSIGNILSMEYLANVNLSKLIERSFGVFGSTGSGKTFFTRIILAGLIKKDVCANLIFDFHEEYGIKGASEESESVPGLAYLFSSKVIIYTVEPKGLTREKYIQIPLSDIEPEDIRLISKELRLSEMSFETAL
jgi:DNA helicase HerA-like ATPase